MKDRNNLANENKELKARLAEAEELLAAIKSGGVDAFVTDDQQVFTLKSVDHAYRVLVETMNEGAATLAFDGTLLYCNTRLAEFFGLPIEKIVGASILDFVVPDEVKKLKSLLTQSKNQTTRIELQFKRNGKNPIPTLVSCNPLEAEIKGLCMVITDLTEQRNIALELEKHRDHLEELIKERTGKLAETEARFRALTETSPLAVGVGSYDGKVLYINKAYERLFGYTIGELTEVNSSRLWVDPKDRQKMIEAVKAKGVLIDYETQLKRKDGTLLWASITVNQIHFAGSQAVMAAVYDITERKLAEEDLMKMRDILSDSQKIAHLGSFEYVLATRTTIWSEEEYRIYGLDPAGPSPEYDAMLKKCIYPDDAALLHETFTKAIQNRSVYELEHRIVRPDGSVRWVYDRAHPYFDEKGNLLRYVGGTLDITERKQAEEALVVANKLVQDVIDNTTSIVYALDLQERFVLVNANLAKLLNSTPDQMTGKRRHDFMPQADADWHEANDHKVREAGRAMDFEEKSDLPGHSITWLTTKFPLRDADGKIYAIGGFSTDITDRKRAEDALRVSEENLKRAQAVGNIGSWRLDILRNELVWSDETYNIFGVTKGTPQTYESFLSMVHPDDRTYIEKKWKLAIAGEEYDIEHRIIVDDEIKWVREKAFLEVDKQGTLLAGFGITQDITIRKQAEEILKRDKETFERLVQERSGELVEAQVELEKAKRLSDIGTLAATVAHELRNPLAAIGVTAHNIKRKANNPDIDNHIRTIDKKVAESDQIINNLLFYSRLKPPHYESINIFDIIEECVETAEQQKKEATVIKNLDSIKGIMIEVDPLQIKEVFDNILNNAFDAIPAEKGQIKITAENEDEFIKVTIEDSGPGIVKDILDKIFEPFFTTKAKGTGLGLSVCRQIIDMHEGEIGVKSELGQGTSFTVRLPKKERKKERKNKWPLREF